MCRSLGQEDPLEEEMITHSSILAWRIPQTEEPGGLQSTGWRRVGHNLATEHFTPFPRPELRKASRIWKGVTPPRKEGFPLSPKEQPCYPTPPPLPKAEEGGTEWVRRWGQDAPRQIRFMVWKLLSWYWYQMLAAVLSFSDVIDIP